MGKLTPTKRKKITDLVMGVVKRLDTGKKHNISFYENMLSKMSDKQFEEWANSMGHNLDDTIQLFMLPFEEPKMDQIQEAAKFLKLPLEEYVYYYHNDEEGIRTKTKVPVGYVHLKRTQQMLSKKNRYSMDADDTNMKVGQVIGDSKVASISEPETFFLTALNANRALEELLGPRADNQSKKQQMYQQIARDGFTSLDTLEEDVTKNTTLNTVDTYMLASGIKSNLLTSTLKTHHTIDSQLRNKK